MIKIEFSHGYDSSKVSEEKSTSGFLRVGSMGLITALETQLCLPSKDISFTSRLVQYHQCIKQTINDNRFFYHSFNENEFATTRTLLLWRDELYLGGWKGNFSNSPPSRLNDFAEIEKIARDKVLPNVGQRLQRIIELLGNNQVQIESLTILDELDLLPPIYQDLFNALGKHCTVINRPFELKPSGTKGTDLCKLQTGLSGDSLKDKIKLKGDGSVAVWKAASQSVSSSKIAADISKTFQSSPNTTYGILAEKDGELIDNALEAFGAARNGFSSNSPWRPAFQVLPLCFEILWEPLNPYALLQFLSHPVGPIPRSMREALANCVAEYPGLGSESWNNVIESQFKKLAESDQALAERSKKAVDSWIPTQLYCPNDGMPLVDIISRLQKLKDWLTGMQTKHEETHELPLYTAALNQVTELLHAIQYLEKGNIETLNRENLRHLISDIRGSGISLADRHAEVGPSLPLIQTTSSPAGFHVEQDIVIWWGCEGHASIKKTHWLQEEVKALRNESVLLWQNRKKLQLEARDWLKPILMAKKQAIIVLHPELAQHHPVMDNITGIAEGWTENRLEESLLNNEEIVFSGIGISTKDIGKRTKHLTLPEPKRWWQLPEDIHIPKRDKESYSSLDKFIYSPYQWVLNYQAKLRSTSLAELKDANILKGSLAHRLFEIFFNEYPDLNCTQSNLDSWCKSQLNKLLETEGAVLLTPGRRSEELFFRDTTTFALQKLLLQLKSANIEKLQMEASQNGSFAGGKLTGSIDLLAIKKGGKEVVLDMKWGGLFYRKEALEQDNYLQLATYAAMRKEKTGNWPSLAYFIISDARLLCNDRYFFPDAEYVETKSGESVAEFWKRFVHTWEWRREQLDSGAIELTTSKTELDLDSSPDEKCLIIPESSDYYDDYVVLTGWEKK